MDTKVGNILFGNKNIEYVLERSNRKKTVAITVTPTAQVVVNVPHMLNIERIERILKKKVQWIHEKQKFIRKMVNLYPQREFVSGESFPYLGHLYRLKVNKVYNSCPAKIRLNGRKILIMVNGYMTIGEYKEIIRKLLMKWYYSETKKILERRINYYSKFLDLYPSNIIIKNQQKRWGSCSKNGILRFNWKISMAPIQIIDYIVAHELCHLRVKNHSADFWKCMSSVLPNYKEYKDWLKKNLSMLRI